MPRCSTHCPPRKSSSSLVPVALVVASAVALAANWTAIVHVITILLATAGIVAGLTIAGLTTAVIMRLRRKTREPWMTGPVIRASTQTRPAMRRVAVSQRTIPSGNARAIEGPHDYQTVPMTMPAAERHLHLHWHDAKPPELSQLLNRPRGL